MRKESWWTGEDSNLRSSKERQIYSLLPLTARPPVHALTELSLTARVPLRLTIRARPPAGNSNEDNKECANILAHTKSACRGKFLKECVPLEDPRAATLAIYRHAHAPSARADSVLWSWRRDSNP